MFDKELKILRPTNKIAIFNQLARKGDVFGSLKLVSCQHDELNTPFTQRIDSLRHIVLQSVLDPSGTDQSQLTFDITLPEPENVLTQRIGLIGEP